MKEYIPEMANGCAECRFETSFMHFQEGRIYLCDYLQLVQD
jgi:hypothetical protein